MVSASLPRADEWVAPFSGAERAALDSFQRAYAVFVPRFALRHVVKLN